MNSIEHTKTFCMDRPVAEIFPLFSPKGEVLWVPGWSYESPMESTELCEDYVFLTESHDHAGAEAVWVVKRYDPAAYLVEYYKIEPNRKVGTIRVKCASLGKARTGVEVTYKYTAISAEGKAFISGFSAAAYDRFIGEWQTLLANYFASRR